MLHRREKPTREGRHPCRAPQRETHPRGEASLSSAGGRTTTYCLGANTPEGDGKDLGFKGSAGERHTPAGWEGGAVAVRAAMHRQSQPQIHTCRNPRCSGPPLDPAAHCSIDESNGSMTCSLDMCIFNESFAGTYIPVSPMWVAALFVDAHIVDAYISTLQWRLFMQRSPPTPAPQPKDHMFCGNGQHD